MGVGDPETVGVGTASRGQVGVAVGVAVRVAVAVGVSVGVKVAVAVGVPVGVGLGVCVGVAVGEGLAVAVAVGEGVPVAVAVAVQVGVAVGSRTFTSPRSPVATATTCGRVGGAGVFEGAPVAGLPSVSRAMRTMSPPKTMKFATARKAITATQCSGLSRCTALVP